MAWSSSNICITIFLSLLLLQFPTETLAKRHTAGQVQYHNGPILTGQVNLAVLWYGRFGASQKKVLRDFIKSLNKSGPQINDPSVATWWKMVEQYQSMIPGRNARRPIKVKMVKAKTDKNYSVGKVLTTDFYQQLADKVTIGAPPAIAVIFADRSVTIQETCMGKCSVHGTVGTGRASKLYIVVGNPESECPSDCAWPFYKGRGPQTLPLPLLPPNGNIGVDAMVVNFATALAETVTNPYNTGFFGGNNPFQMIEIGSLCKGVFGSGSFPGFTGKIHMQPGRGGCFNAHGINNRRFLLPAVWNPRTRTCQTLM